MNGPSNRMPHPSERTQNRRAAWVLLFALALLQAGCGSGLLSKPAPPPTLLTLGEPPWIASAPAPATPPARTTGTPAGEAAASAPPTLTVQVDTPRAASGHDSALMAYQRTPQRIDYYARHQWVDTPAHMLGPWLVQALQQSGAFAAVLPGPAGAAVDWRLQTDNLQLLHHVPSASDGASAGAVTASSHVTLRLDAVLIDSRTRRVLATRQFESTQPAPSTDAAGAAAAAQAAAQVVSREVAAFCAQASANPRKINRISP